MNNKGKIMNVIAWVLFLLAIGFFCLQVGYFLAHEKFQIEYMDNRIFYIINICFVLCLFFGVVLLLRLNKKSLFFTFIIGSALIVVNVILCISNNQQVRNIVSISPDFQHVLSIKEDRKEGESIYYRSSFLIFARPMDKLPYEMNGEYKVEWLTNDIAAFTYKAKNQTVHQFIATYGDRGSGISYYNVGPEIQGKWQSGDVEVISDMDGIMVTEKGITERYDWDHIIQFGTLAIVLMKNDEAVWTIALDENFKVESDSSISLTNEIILYKASMEENQPIQMHYKGLN
ncbi:hypothetical protein H9636_18725 [Ureibacillus sp. Re31]|uniref:Uncharacterized protein n=1 Tax=Ureibacillus galli TaxID=2762222 RepID=A0ABR8XHH1_9BACL|nr:hypothetical protein [Ureibacillus galli]MBD8028666.1 hypothetical protein [Ureibacillus galli]